MANVITLAQAIQMTTLFREQKENIIHPDFQGKNILPNAETFDRAVFDKVLAQPGCVRLRLYFSMKDDLQVRAVIVGVNEKNEDMLPTAIPASDTASSTPTTDDDDNTIIEEGTVCPPICPPVSALNT